MTVFHEKRTVKPAFISWTLFSYSSRNYLFSFFGFFAVLMGVVFLISLLEVSDDLEDKAVPFLQIVKIVLYRLPQLSEEIMPFMILFAAMATFWKMTRANELVIIKTAGVSIWGIILPFAFCSLMIGVLSFAVINPISSALFAKNKELEQLYKKSDQAVFKVSETGLWLRQSDETGISVIHAGSVNSDLSLNRVIIFQLAEDGDFLSRYDSTKAQLADGSWILEKVWHSFPGEKPTFLEETRLPTELTMEKVQESFATPKSISFWELPYFINLLENAGFSAIKHKLQFHRLLSKPFLFIAMVLLAATFSMQQHRRGRVGLMILSGILTGFMLYFLSNFVFALGQSAKVPIALAAWSPAGVSLLLGVTMLLHLEDG
ncbi:LPS export ABC transporter permease LptG [Kiloniella laminariae]|uniref:LPS export ABC transporter permease LptG n=1 Tax=Kiloniella laminariae TaxID=454162 RepID=UPI000367E105|nr:LPS export ABC transporter permease LptG [Kiloniella laminariae]